MEKKKNVRTFLPIKIPARKISGYCTDLLQIIWKVGLYSWECCWLCTLKKSMNWPFDWAKPARLHLVEEGVFLSWVLLLWLFPIFLSPQTEQCGCAGPFAALHEAQGQGHFMWAWEPQRSLESIWSCPANHLHRRFQELLRLRHVNLWSCSCWWSLLWISVPNGLIWFVCFQFYNLQKCSCSSRMDSSFSRKPCCVH